MTYEQDPARWSDSSNTDVPDVLRDLMRAGAEEGPSAAKLAALGAKVSVSATTGAAASATTSGVLGTAKLWVAGAAIGAAVIGAVAIQAARPDDVTPRIPPTARSLPEESAPVASPKTPSAKTPVAPAARLAAPAPAPIVDRAAPSSVAAPHVTEPGATERVAAQEVASAEPEQAVTPQGADQPAAPAIPPADQLAAQEALDEATPSRNATAPNRAAAPDRRAASRRVAPIAQPQEETGKPAAEAKKPSVGAASTPSDVQLLLEARNALASSPQRALALATRHAAAYPDSQFRQERDALVIEALTRSGQLERARDEARSFIQRYPSSANAHRFRERLNL